MDKNQYNFDERLDYIAYMLNVRTKGKAYENFIVNAIYSKVGNLDLVPVTQQYVRSRNPQKSYYLLDLYFPQLNFGIEIDEIQHNNTDQRKEDEIRGKDISAAIQCEEYRIPIYADNSSQKRTISEIEKDIDQVVSVIKKKIARKRGGIKWELNKEKKAIVKKRGTFRDTDDVDYNGITEIYNLCGGRRNGPHKNEPVKALQRCSVVLNAKYKLWVPKLAIQLPDGNVTNTANEFVNLLSEDHKKITEINVGKKWKVREKEKEKKYKRVVFMQMWDQFGKRCVKFLGVYKQMNSPDPRRCAIYKKIASEVAINELK